MSQVNSAHESESHLAALGGTMNCSNVFSISGAIQKVYHSPRGEGVDQNDDKV